MNTNQPIIESYKVHNIKSCKVYNLVTQTDKVIPFKKVIGYLLAILLFIGCTYALVLEAGLTTVLLAYGVSIVIIGLIMLSIHLIMD